MTVKVDPALKKKIADWRKKMKADPSFKAFEKMSESYKLDISIRGRYIVDTLTVEMLISYIIAFHFFPNSRAKRDWFFSLVLNHREFTFSMKFEIFMDIIKSKYNTLFREHSGNLKKVSHVMTLRNKLAHCYFDEQDKIIVPKETIRLSYYKKGKEEKLDLTKSQMDKESQEILDIVVSLLQIRDRVSKRKKT